MESHIGDRGEKLLQPPDLPDSLLRSPEKPVAGHRIEVAGERSAGDKRNFGFFLKIEQKIIKKF